jgi:protein-tyrosine phosphatase
MVKVLFVCMGNICRSPTAHGLFLKMIEDESLSHLIDVDSAGTHAYHVGEAPDPRARDAAARRGIDLERLRARKVTAEDFDRCDYVLAMDRDNFERLEMICPAGQEAKLRLFLDFAADQPVREVPDPYYGGESGFERVLDLIEAASLGLLDDIRARHL